MINLKLPFQGMFQGLGQGSIADIPGISDKKETPVVTATKKPQVAGNTAILKKYTPAKALDFNRVLEDIELPQIAPQIGAGANVGFDLSKPIVKQPIQKDTQAFKINLENIGKTVSSVAKPFISDLSKTTGVENFSDWMNRTGGKALNREQFVRGGGIEPLAVDYADAFWKTTQDFVSQTYQGLLSKAKNYVNNPEQLIKDTEMASPVGPISPVINIVKAAVGKDKSDKLSEWIANGPLNLKRAGDYLTNKIDSLAKSEQEFMKTQEKRQRLQPRAGRDTSLEGIKDTRLKDPTFRGYNMVKTLPYALVAVASSYVGGTPAMISTFYPSSYKGVYDDLKSAGAEEQTAQNLASAGGWAIAAIEGVLDQFQLSKIPGLKKLVKTDISKGVTTAIKNKFTEGLKVGGQIVASENIEELLQGAIQDGLVKFFDENKKILGNYRDTIARTTIATLPMALLGGGGIMLGDKYGDNELQKDIAEIGEAIEQGRIVSAGGKVDKDKQIEEISPTMEEETTKFQEKEEPLMEEAKKYKSAEEFVKDTVLKGKRMAPNFEVEVSKPKGTFDGSLQIHETPQVVYLTNISLNNKSTGIGTNVVERLKAYVDSKGKELRIVKSSNDKYRESFPFLIKSDIDAGYKYIPKDGYIPFSRTPSGFDYAPVKDMKGKQVEYNGKIWNVEDTGVNPDRNIGVLFLRDLDGVKTSFVKYGGDYKVIEDITTEEISPIIEPEEEPATMEDKEVRYQEKEEPLIAEARKYKSADEFIKTLENENKIVYHGTNKQFEKFSKEFIGENQQLDRGEGISFTDNVNVAKSFARDAGGDIIMKTSIEGINFADGNKLMRDPELQDILDDGMGFQDIYEDYLLPKGFDGIKFKHKGDGGTEYVVYNIDKIKTESQLKQIREEANKQPAKYQEKEDQIYSEKFKNRFGDRENDPENASKVVDEDGKPLVVYHGTVSDFTVFDKLRANPESDMGAGFYFTDNDDDVSVNYEGGGPDYENKVSLLAERMEGDEGISYDEAKIKAREQLGKGSKKLEVYLNIKNPLVLGGGKETYLFENTLDMEDFDSEDEYYEAIDQETQDLIDKIGNATIEYNIDAGELRGELNMYEYMDGISASEFIEKLKSSDAIMFAEGDGGMVGNEIIRKIFEELDFDGIIDHTVYDKFGYGRRTGQPMEGLDYDTTHYIVFEPNQIKSATENIGEFSPYNEDIRYQEKIKLYHGTNKEFNEFILDNAGEGQGDLYGKGIYLTDNEDYGRRYARLVSENKGGQKILIETTIEDSLKILDVDQKLQKSEVEKILENYDKKNGGKKGKELFESYDEYEEGGDFSKTFEQLRMDMDAGYGGENATKLNKALDGLYDGLRIENATMHDEPQNGYSYVIFDPKKIDLLKWDKFQVKERQESAQGQPLTADQARQKLLDIYPNIIKDLGLSIETVDKIMTPRGTEAYGMYRDGLIAIAKDPINTTAEHELVHAVIDLALSSEEKSYLFAEVKKKTGLKDKVSQEEWIANNFDKFIKGKAKIESKEIKNIFQKIRDFIKYVFKEKSKVDQLFSDMLDVNKKRTRTQSRKFQKYGPDSKMQEKFAEDIISADAERQAKAMKDIARQTNQEWRGFAERIQKIEEEEKRIGTVAGKKIGKEAADQQMRAWEKKKERLIEEIAEYYGIDANDAFDKYGELRDLPLSQIQVKKGIAKQVKVMKSSREKGRDKDELRAYNKAREIMGGEEADRAFGEDFYRKNTPLKKKKGGRWANFKEFISDRLEPISYRLGRIDKSIKTRVREFDYRELVGSAEMVNASRTFLDQMAELRKDPDLFNQIDLALKNRDTKKIEEIGVEVPRDVLDYLQQEAEKVGLEVSYLKDYFPRVVENSKGLLEEVRGTDARGFISDAVKLEEAKKGRALTIEEKAEIANKLLSGYKVNGIIISVNNLKERTIDVITSKLNQYYKDPVDGYVEYIAAMVRAIELKKLFGDPDPEKAIGVYIAELIDSKKIKPQDEQELVKLLKVRFNPDTAGAFVSNLRSLIALTSMGSPISAISQMQDLAFSIYESGLANMLKKGGIDIVRDLGIDVISNEFSDASAIQRLTDFTFKLTGFRSMDMFGKTTMVNSYFNKIQGLAKKEDVAFMKELVDMFVDTNRTETILEDLKKGIISDDVKFLLFNKMAEYQPITQTEMPFTYLKSGANRLFYVLKSFTLKQMESIRREGLDNIKDGVRKSNEITKLEKEGKLSKDEADRRRSESRKQAIQGAKNLMKLATLLFVGGWTADEIKDFLLFRKSSNIWRYIYGDKLELGTKVIDNLWKLVGLSKYTVKKAQNESFANALAAQLFVPLGFADNIVRDLRKVITRTKQDLGIEGPDVKQNLNWNEVLKSLESYQNLPVVGKMRYRWFGQPRMTQGGFTPGEGLKDNKYYRDVFSGELIRKKESDGLDALDKLDELDKLDVLDDLDKKLKDLDKLDKL